MRGPTGLAITAPHEFITARMEHIDELTNTAHKRLPGGATPHLNNNATKEHYTHERDEGKGGKVPMEQNWEEKESCK